MHVRALHTHTLTRWHIAECGVCRCCVFLQFMGDQQLAETHHDWIVVIVISKDHPDPSAVAWNTREILLDPLTYMKIALLL